MLAAYENNERRNDPPSAEWRFKHLVAVKGLFKDVGSSSSSVLFL